MDAKTFKEVTIAINLGVPICQKLKEIYFPDETWFLSYRRLADKFSQLKQIARKFYNDNTETEILQHLGKYSVDDIKDLFETSTPTKA
jgi:hypothetical protein